MSIFQAIVLGVVQGVTEFLPVSSSGHLALMQILFGINEPALLFDICLHIGTLAAVVVVLRADIFALLRRPFQKRSLLIIAATVCTAALAFAFKKFSADGGAPLLESAFTSTTFLGCAFLITSLSLTIAELIVRNAHRIRGEETFSLRDAVIIGCAQGVAVLPGISRSGLTLAAALGCKLERSFAARFSFLLSIPAILGALVLELGGGAMETISGIGAAPIAAGTLAAAITGFFAIRLMLHLVRTRPLYVFSVYTALLGIAILIAL